MAKTNKIKKVDIDFDFDNFNPGFDSVKIDGNKPNFESKDNNVFNPQPTRIEKQKETSNEISDDFKKKLANKKAISSDDFIEE